MSGLVTELLDRAGHGDSSALDQLAPMVYDELRRLARKHLRGERRDHTLASAALVHEAYLKLVDQTKVRWQNRAHFFAVAARIIRRILVDHARNRHAQKRGGPVEKLSLEQAIGFAGKRDLELVALDEALHSLSRLDERQSRIVELRFFGGLSIEETAEVLGISPATVKRDWITARAWLLRQLSRRPTA